MFPWSQFRASTSVHSWGRKVADDLNPQPLPPGPPDPEGLALLGLGLR